MSFLHVKGWDGAEMGTGEEERRDPGAQRNSFGDRKKSSAGKLKEQLQREDLQVSLQKSRGREKIQEVPKAPTRSWGTARTIPGFSCRESSPIPSAGGQGAARGGGTAGGGTAGGRCGESSCWDKMSPNPHSEGVKEETELKRG